MDQPKRTRCEIYSRVVGFLSPVSQWNKGKAAEFQDRHTFEGSSHSAHGGLSQEEITVG